MELKGFGLCTRYHIAFLLIILLIATVFFQYRNNPIIEKVFLGVRPAVVALIASAVYKLMKSYNSPMQNYL